MRKIIQYSASLLVATITFGIITVFVPGYFAMCKCTFNEIAKFRQFPGSLFAALLVVGIAYFYSNKGSGYLKVFLVALLVVGIFFAGSGFLIKNNSSKLCFGGIPG